MNIVDYVAPSRQYFFAVNNLWRRNLYNMLIESRQHQESDIWIKQVTKTLRKEIRMPCVVWFSRVPNRLPSEAVC